MDATAARESKPLDTIPLRNNAGDDNAGGEGTAAVDWPTGGRWCEKEGKEGKEEAAVGGAFGISCFMGSVFGCGEMWIGEGKWGDGLGRLELVMLMVMCLEKLVMVMLLLL